MAPLAIRMDAFNLIPGIAFTIPGDTCPATDRLPRVYVAQHVTRDHNRELVNVWAHTYDDDGIPTHRALVQGFCDAVYIVGVSVNPMDEDDWNLGTRVAGAGTVEPRRNA